MRYRGILTAGLAFGLLGLGAPPAPATDVSDYGGGCGADTVNDTTPGGPLGGQSHWVGTVDTVVVLFSQSYGNVVTANLTCELRVNGVTVRQFYGSGAGVVVIAAPVTFDAEITDVVEWCTIVDFTSDPTPTRVDCRGGTETRLVPRPVVDLLNWAIDVAFAQERKYADSVVCAVFQALAPGTDPVSITPEGDVYIGDNAPEDKAWDCAPYDIPHDDPGPPPWWPVDPTRLPSGGGWNDGDTGFLALVTPGTTTTLTWPPGVPAEAYDIASACAFRTDRDAGTISVTGSTAAGRTPVADTASIHCVLEDAATGAVFYDHTETTNAPVVTWRDTVPAIAGKVTVCTEGGGVWGTRTVTVGQYCRPGLPI